MADELHLGSGNWWESSARNRYESQVGSTTASTSSLNNNNNNNNNSNSMVGSFGWPTEIGDIKARSSMDSVSVSGNSMVFQSDSQKLQLHESSPLSGGAAASGLLPDPNLQMMGLGLSSPTMDWNQALFRGEKGEGSFRSMLQEEASSTNFPQQDQWRHKIYSRGSEDSSNISHDLKQMNRGLSLDQPQFSSTMSSGSNHPNFQLDSSATYGTGPPPNVLQGLLVSDNQQQQQQQQSMNYSYQISSGYGGMTAGTDQIMAPSWSNKFPPFLRTSPPKQPPQFPPHHHHHQHHHGQLQFSNNTPFWNASSAASMNDGRSTLFTSLQSPIPVPNFEEKSKNTSEARDLTIAKKSSNESSNKRTRNEAPAPMPAFKVRKEKMGDRITALQQLVSPFGKTDTASVLSEAIEYIKFLQEQVGVLSAPYMKSGGPLTHQQNPDKPRDPAEGPKQDLRSRGLCLVPISITYPVTHETTVDFWTPTYGGTFR